MNTQLRIGVTALVLLALVACLAFANQHRLKVGATVDLSGVAPERERNGIAFALEVGHRPDAGTIVRVSARAAFSLAEG